MSERLYIAAKRPDPGRVKTRLAAGIGEGAAAELYRAFLADLAARYPDAAWYVSPARWQPGPRVLAQPAGTWTERQRHLFRGARARGEERTVLVASDSPQLPAEVVAEAFALLRRHDVVLGPVEDGGYCLIGMRGWHDVLAGVAMSTGSVLQEIRRRAAALGVGLALLPATYDVDELDDLERLHADAARREDLPATRAALAALAAAAPA